MGRPGSQRRSRGQGRGGPREGTPGTAYANRSDLNQPVRVAPSATYGQGVAQQQAQRAVPLPAQAPAPAAAPSGGPVSSQPGPPLVTPGSLGALNAPSVRPNEPLTAGLPTGAGPGPEALNGIATTQDPTLATLKGILARYPNPDLQALILEAESATR